MRLTTRSILVELLAGSTADCGCGCGCCWPPSAATAGSWDAGVAAGEGGCGSAGGFGAAGDGSGGEDGVCLGLGSDTSVVWVASPSVSM